MAFRQMTIPAIGRPLSNVMADPSSAERDGQVHALDGYRELGGNCLHLHDEGDEAHARRAVGQWLHLRGARQDFFLCSQICHAGWDAIAQRSIDRFHPSALMEDIHTDLELLGTDYLDLVYLDDSPQTPLEPVIEALGRETRRGRIRAFGFRNWTADRIRSAHAHTEREGLPGPAVLVTTELALPVALAPLWPEYVPFDRELREIVGALGLAVFAHASDINLGQCLWGDGDATSRLRSRWVQRWANPANKALVARVREFATTRGITSRAVNIAWLLSQPFPSVAIAPLSSFGAAGHTDYEQASQLVLEEADLDRLFRG